MVPLLALMLLVIPVEAIGQSAFHATWTDILGKYVDESGYVDYVGLAANRGEFDRYVAFIESSGPETNPADYPDQASRLAYYINAYNVMVFRGVLNRGPEQKSVWRGLISGLNFFVRMDIRVDGHKTNLKNLEDDIVRARFNDPRIHGALNCASAGCPRLIREAYTAEQLDRQLDDAVVEFTNSAQHIRVEPEKQRAGLSKIFDWYEEDFTRFEEQAGNTAASESKKLLGYVNRYRPDDRQIPLDYKVYFLDYDKAINKQ